MIQRTLRCSLIAAALLAACGGKKSPPAGGSGSAGPIDAVGPITPPTAAGADAAAAAAPPPLPPLAADPGGATGDVMSITPFGGPKTDSTRAIAVTGDGGAVVAGYFEDTAKFGAVEKTGAGKSDAFVAKLGADGAVASAGGLGARGKVKSSHATRASWAARCSGVLSWSKTDCTVPSSSTAFLRGLRRQRRAC